MTWEKAKAKYIKAKASGLDTETRQCSAYGMHQYQKDTAITTKNTDIYIISAKVDAWVPFDD
jgi:hypothetical protein